MINRRDFLKQMNTIGAVAILGSAPWVDAFGEMNNTQNEKLKVGIIGPGSRGRFLMSFLVKNPKVDIIAICDNYQPSIDEALKMVPDAKVYTDYRKLLENKDITSVVVATPLYSHCQIVLDAFDAGKNVYCEKTIGFTPDECLLMYDKYKSSNKIFFTGQQRLFDPRYLKTMEMVHQGMFGEIAAVHTFWNRNGDWRRAVPSPDLERKINWRLYKEYSKGLMTELGCHQIQIGTWAMKSIPEKIMGHGAITFWKDGREVYDNVNVIYVLEDGRKITFGSVISNKFYGLEEQILGNKGTVEPEKGKYYFENPTPDPAFLRMINKIERDVFDAVPFAGTSWAPETGSQNKGEYILGETPQTDGTCENLAAFVEASITNKQPEKIAEEGYYASVLALLGHEAIEQEQIISFPEHLKLDYLNHKRTIFPGENNNDFYSRGTLSGID